ncbi:hypothetical protein [Streptomyces hygroscopicus]|uniref:hypothetical protein n=1 Tax=Streptomyces hygroscopicus TaxID=1912 RepID=UPI001F260589|nr:hypothetical protein [Streptomyces hygroscopicus]
MRPSAQPAHPHRPGRRRRLRLRRALSRWYFGKRVELPVADAQRRRIEVVRAAPGEAAEAGHR